MVNIVTCPIGTDCGGSAPVVGLYRQQRAFCPTGNYSGNHHTCSYNLFVLLFCSLDYISITMSSNGNLTMQV